MHLPFPKCLLMAEAGNMCPAPVPVSHGGVWLTWFLSDDTLGYSLRGGWMVVTGSPRSCTGLFCVRHRVFQQVLWTQKALCLLGCVLSLGTWCHGWELPMCEQLDDQVL